MKAAPYTRETLDRIRKGACAADLGWDQNFYLTVCRRHEIDPVAPSIPQPVRVTAPPAPPQTLPVPMADDVPRFDAGNNIVLRGSKAITLGGRQARVFALLASADDCVSSFAIDEELGIERNNVGGIINGLRVKLKPLRLWVRGEKRRGYRIVTHKNEPVKVIVAPIRDTGFDAP